MSTAILFKMPYFICDGKITEELKGGCDNHCHVLHKNFSSLTT